MDVRKHTFSMKHMRIIHNIHIHVFVSLCYWDDDFHPRVERAIEHAVVFVVVAVHLYAVMLTSEGLGQRNSFTHRSYSAGNHVDTLLDVLSEASLFHERMIQCREKCSLVAIETEFYTA